MFCLCNLFDSFKCSCIPQMFCWWWTMAVTNICINSSFLNIWQALMVNFIWSINSIEIKPSFLIQICIYHQLLLFLLLFPEREFSVLSVLWFSIWLVAQCRGMPNPQRPSNLVRVDNWREAMCSEHCPLVLLGGLILWTVYHSQLVTLTLYEMCESIDLHLNYAHISCKLLLPLNSKWLNQVLHFSIVRCFQQSSMSLSC